MSESSRWRSAQAPGLSGNGYGNRRTILKNYQLNQCVVAETEGFEPSVPVNPVRRFSKPLVSATHPRLRITAKAGYSRACAADQQRVRMLPGLKSTRLVALNRAVHCRDRHDGVTGAD